MSAYDKINDTPILEVLSYLGIEYNSSRCIKEGGSSTSGRKVNLQGNYVNDFSNNRSKGGPFSFVKQYFNFTNAETYKRFKEKFGIYDTEYHGNRSRRTTRNKKIFISYRP